MDTRDFQNLCADVVAKIDRRHKIDRNPHLSFTQLMEEIGELARAVNLPKLRGKKLDQGNLEEEFADVLLQLAVLAKLHNVDFEGAVKKKISELEARNKISAKDVE